MRYEVFVCDLCGSEHPKERSHESIILNRYSHKEFCKDICARCSEAIHTLVQKLMKTGAVKP